MENTVGEKKKSNFWNFIDNFKGDKVIWMIVLLLILISLVTIFSSASGLAKGDTTRLDIFFSQFKLVCGGLAVILLCYNVPSIGFIRVASQTGFLVSVGLLICLNFGIGAIEVNGAVRSLQVGGMQIYVFEVIKVAMVMYLAWAVNAYRNGGFKMSDLLAQNYKSLAFLGRPFAKRMLYIYAPILIVCAGMFRGGVSSTLFTGLVMFLTILIGGMPKKEILGATGIACCLIGLFVGLHIVSDGEMFPRIGTAANRLTLYKEYDVIEKELEAYEEDKAAGRRHVWSQDYRDAMDKIRQPEGAKIAVKEGGLLGKGPGNSTQKYAVYAIFSDYMYSFIIEEYGLVGGIIVLILYASLLARGSIIARMCDSLFAKTAVAGLVLLISGQALMHMLINVNIGPLTGQTLPMVSHGSSSFLSFSVAFGVLLSISRLAKEKMDARYAAAEAEEQGKDEEEGNGQTLTKEDLKDE